MRGFRDRERLPPIRHRWNSAIVAVIFLGAVTGVYAATTHDTGSLSAEEGNRMVSIGPDTNTRELGAAILFRNALYAIEGLKQAIAEHPELADPIVIYLQNLRDATGDMEALKDQETLKAPRLYPARTTGR